MPLSGFIPQPDRHTMGRLKRYKKIKACDPTAAKRRDEKEDKYDLPPDEEDIGKEREGCELFSLIDWR